MRARFPVDSELDAMLVRKLRRRTSSSYQRITLDDFVACLESLLRDNIDGDFVVSDARWLSGGASKMQMRFTLEWQDPDRGRVTDVMVVRMDPAESLNATSRSQEAQILIARAWIRARTGSRGRRCLPSPRSRQHRRTRSDEDSGRRHLAG